MFSNHQTKNNFNFKNAAVTITTKTALIFIYLSLFLSGCRLSLPFGNDVEIVISSNDNGEVILTGIREEVIVTSPEQIQEFTSVQPFLPDDFEIGFSPIGTPIRIAVNSEGKLLISAEAKFVTPYGVFDITTSKDIIKQSQKRLLIIQIDNLVSIYQLGDDEFKIDYSDKDHFYRLISFRQDKQGNIELVLSSTR